MRLLNFKKTKKASATTTGEFPFADAPNTATIVCCHIIECKAPILYVSHDEDDGMWQFLCGKTHEMNDAKMVSLKYAYELDHSLGELAGMPCGCIAERLSQEAKWVTKKS